MDERVIEIITRIMPEAKIEQSPGGYKIRLPQAVNTMEGYEDLRKTLKESAIRPLCIYCQGSNTKFRYFDNNSSTVLQARYRCNNCLRDFTLGGRQYAISNQSRLSIPADQSKRGKRAMNDDEDNLQLALGTKRTRRSWPNIGFDSEGTHGVALPAHQSQPPQEFYQGHEQQLGHVHQQQYLSHVYPPPNPNDVSMAFCSTHTGFPSRWCPPLQDHSRLQLRMADESMKIAASKECTPLSLQYPASSSQNLNVNVDPLENVDLSHQEIKQQELLQAIVVPYASLPRRVSNEEIREQELLEAMLVPHAFPPGRVHGKGPPDTTVSENTSQVENIQGRLPQEVDTNVGDELKAMLDSPEKDFDLWALLSDKKK